MKILFLILFCFSASASFAQTNCLETAREIEPQFSAETKREFEAKLADAQAQLEKNANDANALIWLGRRTAYLGRYKDSIRIYTKGIEKFPNDARFYRHRGHRFITLRCFDAAIEDFEKAARLVRGKPDEIEPDGLPNARNTPTSTLQSNIFYHLGLAHYLKGDFRRALSAYREALKVSKNPDMLVATTHWLYMTLRRLGKESDAQKTLKAVADNLDIIENENYYRLVKYYQGKLKANDLLKEIGEDFNTLNNSSIAYALGNWFFYNGRRDIALGYFRQIVKGNQWASFGYIAAEAELKNDSGK
jgi:tetratricopeptide (TPR) repeat protein